MKKYHILLGILFIIISVCSIDPEAWGRSVDQTYWNKAFEIAEKNQKWVPKNIYETETIFDQNGNQVELNETHIRINGVHLSKPDLLLISRMKNNQDITNDFQMEFNDLKNDVTQELVENDFFEKETMDYITFLDLNIEGKEAIYRFNLNVENESFTGLARIHTQTGCPIYLELKSDCLAEDDIELTQYVETTRYNNDPGNWYAVKISETMNITIKGFFSSFQGKVKTLVRLKDYYQAD